MVPTCERTLLNSIFVAWRNDTKAIALSSVVGVLGDEYTGSVGEVAIVKEPILVPSCGDNDNDDDDSDDDFFFILFGELEETTVGPLMSV